MSEGRPVEPESVVFDPYEYDADNPDDPWQISSHNRPDKLMPNGTLVAELQHICDNALKDLHNDLDHYPEYYSQQKQIESFGLASEGRDGKDLKSCLKIGVLIFTRRGGKRSQNSSMI